MCVVLEWAMTVVLVLELVKMRMLLVAVIAVKVNPLHRMLK
jgi:hypothetical protein